MPNTVLQKMTNLRKMIRIAINRGIISHDPFIDYSPERPKTCQRYVPEKELKKLTNTPLKSGALEVTRDMFVFWLSYGIDSLHQRFYHNGKHRICCGYEHYQCAHNIHRRIVAYARGHGSSDRRHQPNNYVDSEERGNHRRTHRRRQHIFDQKQSYFEKQNISANNSVIFNVLQITGNDLVTTVQWAIVHFWQGSFLPLWDTKILIFLVFPTKL